MNYRAMAEEFAATEVDRALSWLLEQGRETDEAPPGMDEYERMDMGKLLVATGLIYEERTAAGEWTISPLGRKVAEQLIAGRKENGWLRRNLVIREMLVWIDDEQPPNVSAFTGRLVENVAATERETAGALDFLRENDLVRGIRAYGTLMKPKLTSAGRRIKDHPYLPEKALYQGGTVNNDNSNNVTVNDSNVGAVNAGDNAMQSGNSVSVTDSAEILAHIQQIHKALSELPDVPVSTLEALQNLEEAASKPQVEKSQLKEFFDSFTGALAAKFGEDAWSGVLKLTAGLAALIGI